ncbi:MAG: hypothetical protein Q8K99_12830 [Actinomycetota bacterium]|nr:hypothetical protein [Actinomycetota bacterium]
MDDIRCEPSELGLHLADPWPETSQHLTAPPHRKAKHRPSIRVVQVPLHPGMVWRDHVDVRSQLEQTADEPDGRVLDTALWAAVLGEVGEYRDAHEVPSR